MSNGFNAVLPANVMRGAGLLVINDTAPWGSTLGGITFDPGIEYWNREFDGKTCDIEGQDVIIGYKPIITATVFAMSATKLGNYLPGSSSATVSTLTTITPKVAGIELTGTTHYLQAARAVWPLVGGGWYWVKFTRALLTKWVVKGNDLKDATIDVEIAARLDDGISDLGTAPFVTEIETGSSY